MFWNWAPGHSDVIVREDLSKYQHPLAVLMLIAAGASLDFSIAALWLFAPFVVFRMAYLIVPLVIAMIVVIGFERSQLAKAAPAAKTNE